MIIGNWALVLNLASIGLMGLFIAHALQSISWLLIKKKLMALCPQSRKNLLLSWVVSPFILSLVITAFFYLSITGSHEILNNIAHWHHAYVFHFNSWHGFLLVSFILYFLWKLFLAVRQWRSLRSDIKSLNLLSGVHTRSRCDDLNYYLLDSKSPAAFVAGIINPKCYLTSGLKHQLSSNELNIVLKHEQAHIVFNDALSKYLFNLLTIFYPSKIRFQIKQNYILTLEQIADKEVSKSYKAVDVASTLVKVARLQKMHKSQLSFCHFGNEHISLRVEQLIAPNAQTVLSKGMSIIGIILLMLVTLSAIDASHHLVESLFNH